MQDPGDFDVSEELLDEALAESFPASDPLSFWSGRDPRAGADRETGQVVGPGGSGAGSAP